MVKMVIFLIFKVQTISEGPGEKRPRAADLSLATTISVTEVTTMTPVEDFEKLLSMGLQFNAVTVQLEKVILELLNVAFSGPINTKILNCVKTYRKHALERHSAPLFNHFMLELKSAIFKEDKKDIWKIFNDEALTMITVEEDNSSAITTIEAKEYLSSDKSPETGNGDANGDDLLDDL